MEAKREEEEIGEMTLACIDQYHIISMGSLMRQCDLKMACIRKVIL